MAELEVYPYTDRNGIVGSELAFIPLLLSHQNSETVYGLLDSGATVSVLPYSLGLRLGLQWDQQKFRTHLTGNLASFPSFGVLLTGVIGTLPPVTLAFAWTQSDSIPVILGQTNFFQEFDVCFLRSRAEVEIRLASSSPST